MSETLLERIVSERGSFYADLYKVLDRVGYHRARFYSSDGEDRGWLTKQANYDGAVAWVGNELARLEENIL